jgi:tetratricopeptide (TPR) repeat protein
MYSFDKPRPRRPYEKKRASKGGALIFGVGLGAALITVLILVWTSIPNFGTRLNNLPYYARTYYRKLIPHPEYLPAPAASTPISVAANKEVIPLEPDLPLSVEEIPATAAIPPVVSSVVEDTLSLPTPGPTPDLRPLLDSVQLSGFTHQWQTWNNCGPATITTNMSFFGRTETQANAAQFLKPNQDDKNVSPHELAAYVRTTGMEAIVRQGGTIEQLKRFLSNNLPVLTETWLFHDGDGLGHYRLIMGYDDATGQFNTFDSLNGPSYKVHYDQFEADWRVFNRLYLVVYPPEQADLVAAIIGDDMDDTIMYERLLAQAQAEAVSNPDDAIAHFNQGEALTRLDRFQEAIVAFDRARQLGLHWRRLWYQFTPFEAYYAVARYQDVLDLTEATLKGTGGLEEAYYYHGLALHATGQPGAKDDFEAALAYNPLFTPAAEALNQLTQ